jgi:hypothetical protein
MTPHVFLAVPHYGQLAPEALPSLVMATQKHKLTLNTNGASLLAHNFNRLWCQALNLRREREVTHFAMHHADISAQAGWIDVLLEEMRTVGADCLGVVAPIKDARGLTSIGLQHPRTMNIRRLTMKEVMDMPETFDCRDLTQPGFSDFWSGGKEPYLMINTGLFLCDFTRPWVEEFHFEIRDGIVRHDNGKFQASVLPEDWNMSGWMARRGLKVCCTRKVKITHYGSAGFVNDKPWGECATDPGDTQG